MISATGRRTDRRYCLYSVRRSLNCCHAKKLPAAPFVVTIGDCYGTVRACEWLREDCLLSRKLQSSAWWRHLGDTEEERFGVKMCEWRQLMAASDADLSAVGKMEETYWSTKHVVLKKLGIRDDEHLIASDAQLDAKLEVCYVHCSICRAPLNESYRFCWRG